MYKLEKHPQWSQLCHIHQRLKQAGFQSLLAGGAVRDLLLGQAPKDLDLATDATPEQVQALFDKTVMVGEAFGVCRVVLNSCVIEVATFRTDGNYRDGRRPEGVEYSTPEEDAQRRDFTVNALFYDLETQNVLDYVGGQKDIGKRILRTVGDPQARFSEDYLRLLRAVRFVSQLDFKMEPQTQKALTALGAQVQKVSGERLRDEWLKTLRGRAALTALDQVQNTPLWEALFPGWPFLKNQYQEHFPLKQELADDELWGLWFLLHPWPDESALRKTLKQWKLSRETMDKVVLTYKEQGRLSHWVQEESVDWALHLEGKNQLWALRMIERLQGLSSEEKKAKEKALGFFQPSGELPAPLVTGQDLIARGYSPGPEFQKILKDCRREQLLHGLSREALLKNF